MFNLKGDFTYNIYMYSGIRKKKEKDVWEVVEIACVQCTYTVHVDTWQASYSNLNHGKVVVCLQKLTNLLIELTMADLVNLEYTVLSGLLSTALKCLISYMPCSSISTFIAWYNVVSFITISEGL